VIAWEPATAGGTITVVENAPELSAIAVASWMLSNRIVTAALGLNPMPVTVMFPPTSPVVVDGLMLAFIEKSALAVSVPSEADTAYEPASPTGAVIVALKAPVPSEEMLAGLEPIAAPLQVSVIDLLAPNPFPETVIKELAGPFDGVRLNTALIDSVAVAKPPLPSWALKVWLPPETFGIVNEVPLKLPELLAIALPVIATSSIKKLIVEEAVNPFPPNDINEPDATVVAESRIFGLMVNVAELEYPLLSAPRTECEPRLISGMMSVVLENAPFESV
jgi:hypothetical protein